MFVLRRQKRNKKETKNDKRKRITKLNLIVGGEKILRERCSESEPHAPKVDAASLFRGPLGSSCCTSPRTARSAGTSRPSAPRRAHGSPARRALSRGWQRRFGSRPRTTVYRLFVPLHGEGGHTPRLFWHPTRGYRAGWGTGYEPGYRTSKACGSPVESKIPWPIFGARPCPCRRKERVGVCEESKSIECVRGPSNASLLT